jgi:hypothetical protein
MLTPASREERMKKLMLAMCAFSLLAGAAAPVTASPCRDKKGKFIKCPTAKPKVCRDAKGKFTKCK